MAEKEPGDDRPSLQMPSLGFGRKRKRPAAEPPVAPPVAPIAETPAEPEPTQRLDPVPPAPAAPPLFADEAPATQPTEAAVATDTTYDEPEDEDAEPAHVVPKRRRSTLPAIGGMAAAVVTGLVVGLLTVALTWGSLRLCEVVQGTSSCGNPGFFLLLAILVAMVLVGQALLKAFGVPDPGSTSFLGMGLVAVIALLFLVDLLFLWWMVVAIPAVSIAAYALSHWVTTAFVEPAETNLHR